MCLLLLFKGVNRMDKEEHYIILNHKFIKKVRIIKFSGGMYTINVEGSTKYMRVHSSRIYTTYKDAEEVAEPDIKLSRNAQLL